MTNLGLDAAQRVRVDGILAKTQGELKDLRVEFQPRFDRILAEAQTEIETTLNTEQKQRFERFTRENRHWWQPR